MLLMRPLFLLALSGLVTYLVEFYSFALAHSAAGILVVLVCPGILVIVANWLTGVPGWAAAVAVNAVCYELVWRLVLLSRRKEPLDRASDKARGSD
jgi:hypothetical protein